jgi:hypothetical protein
MKIKTSIQPVFTPGTTKSIIKFALWPHRIKDTDTLVWLGRYEILYAMCVQQVKFTLQGKEMEANIHNWVKVSERAL